MRYAEILRKTAETDISLSLNLDGEGKSNIQTGMGFLDHMLTLFSKHAKFDLDLVCNGDLYVDGHHSAEDIGIALGKAFAEAIGDKGGIKRYGSIALPMDEALILVALDISGRGMLRYTASIPTEKVGEFDTELVKEFMQAFAWNAGITLHIRQLDGENSHHIIEGMYKGLGRALREAVSIVGSADDIPSTKGVL